MSHDGQRVLVVDDDSAHRDMLAQILGDLTVEVECAENGAEALECISRCPPALMVLDMRMPVLDGLGTLRALRERGLSVPTLVLTAHADLDDAIVALKLGASDYLRKPIDIASLQAQLQTHLGVGVAAADTAGQGLPALPSGVVVHSPLMLDVLGDLARVAATDAALLLTGETGTGKDVLTHLLHQWSQRSGGPFVPVNIVSLPESLVESELFGHRKGAFTGADAPRTGHIEAAHGGTLFLDEIGEMPLPVQPKLLRVLQDGRVRPLGGTEERAVDFRLVCATNRDLETAVQGGVFRQDLYYRIAVITIEIPPLRERREDVLPLAREFLGRSDGGRKRLSPATEALLVHYSWPGNIRELENTMVRAAILAPGDVILPDNLPPNIRAVQAAAGDSETDDALTLSHVERRAILQALDRCDGNRTEAAQALGISRRKLLYRLKEYRDDSASP